MTTALGRLVAEGFVQGWSVAWPPGPINAEMVRRGLAGHRGSAALVGLGACSGDFLWAIAVASGLRQLGRVEQLRRVLALVSVALLVTLAWVFLRAAVRRWRARGKPVAVESARPGAAHRSFALGFGMALSSPWNVAFWIGVLGGGSAGGLAFSAALTKAGAVVAGAATWVAVLSVALRLGARFATPTWDIVTHAATGLLMLYFAANTLTQFVAAG